MIEQGGVDGILAQTQTEKEIERFLRKTEKLMAIKRLVVSGQRARNQARSDGRVKDEDDDNDDESDQKTPPRSKKKTKQKQKKQTKQTKQKKQKKQKKRGDNDDEEESKYDQFDPVSRTSYYPSDYSIEDTGRQYIVEDAGANKLKFQRQPLPLGPLIKVPPVRRASHPKGWDAPPTPVSSTKPGRAQRLLNKISPFGKK